MKQSDLDEFQRPFCEDERRAVRLLAPAGSGKTQSLLWRCLHQWEKAPDSKPRFLMFTFTRAARDELRERLYYENELAAVSNAVQVSTLNAWGYRRLKNRAHNLRLIASSKERFFAVHNYLQPVWSKHARINKLMTETRARTRAAKAIMDVMDGLKSLGFRHDVHHRADAFTQHSEWLRSVGLGVFLRELLRRLHDLEIVSDDEDGTFPGLEADFLQFWAEATELMRSMAMITLEDQKYWTWLDLESAIADGTYTTGIHRFEHVLVDEFQDINCLDLRLLQAIAAINKAQLTIVGDDDQSIYEWRGASPEFILKPDEHVGEAYSTHILSRNYRSPRNIVEISQRLIQHNSRRVAKKIEAASQQDAQIDVLEMPSIADTIDYVLGEVKSMLDDRNVRNVALIGRKRGQIIPYQIALAGQNVPFYAAEDLQVFLSDAFQELKDILGIKARADVGAIPGFDPVQDLLRLCDRVKRYPLNKSDRASLRRHLQAGQPRTIFDAVSELRRYSGSLKGQNTDGRMSQVFANAAHALLTAKDVASAIRAISEHFSGLQKDYGKAAEDIFYTDPPFIYLRELALRYGSDYSAFIRDIEKSVNTLARVPGDEDDNARSGHDATLRLHLMTALRAKGKEFDAVLLLDVNEDIWPSKLAKTEAQIEQERRVFYVAVTRARKRLVMLVNGRILDAAAAPSPYLAEMGLVPERSKAVA